MPRKVNRGKKAGTVVQKSEKEMEESAANESEELCEDQEDDGFSQEDNTACVEEHESHIDDVTSSGKSAEVSETHDSENISVSAQSQPEQHEETAEPQQVDIADTDSEKLHTQEVTQDLVPEDETDRHPVASSVPEESELATEVESRNSPEKAEDSHYAADKAIMETVDEVGDVEEMNIELYHMDKEEASDDREAEEVQYIDEEAEEEQMCDVSDHNKIIVARVGSKETDDKASRSNQSEGKIRQKKTSGHAVEAYDSKFEEISEGSMGQVEQEEVLNESLSDVEVLEEPPAGETKSSAVSSNRAKEGKGKTRIPYKEAESLEEVFFATENDDARIMAEDKDNDDISDESLSQHGDDNLSLEEISDDDLEPSKKKGRISMASLEKTGNDSKLENVSIHSNEAKPASKSGEKDEDKVASNTSNLAVKRTLGGDSESDEARAAKKSKTSDDDRVPTDDPLFFTGICGNTNSPLTSNVETYQTKSHEQTNRNLQQMAKQESIMRKDKPPSSRDVEPRRSYISSSSQTEPQHCKGKIVQCNITPVKPKNEKQVSEDVVTTSKLFEKFKHQLPSSIPETIFADITSLQPAEENNSYSFSMGPVTLSDMDSPEFRDVAMRGAQKFSLSFGHLCQGIFQATLGKEEDVVSLMRQLKRLELGNRYMVMSILHRVRVKNESHLLNATITFMYEQDIQMECQGLVSDGKLRVKLCLRNVPEGVSKDFVHVLFPEALTVSTDYTVTKDRLFVLGFSNPKMVQEILSCYDMLIINGSQISFEEMDPIGNQQTTDLPSEDSGVPGLVVVEELPDEEREETEAVTDSEEINVQISKSTTSVGGDDETAIDNSADNVMHQERPAISSNNKSEEKDESWVCEEEESGQRQTPLGIDAPKEQNTSDVVGTVDNIVAEDVSDHEQTATEMAANILQTIIDAVVGKASEDVMCSEEIKADEAIENDNENIVMKNTEVTSTSAESVVKEGEKQEGVSQPSLDSVVPERRDVQTVEAGECVATETANRSALQPVSDVQIVTQANEKHLEDVSDDEMLTQSRDNDHPEDVVVVREDPFKKIVANIDLTVEESPNSGTDRNVGERDTGDQIKVVAQEKKSAERDLGSAKKSASGRLIMMDGSLEVSMEVEDVDEEMAYESILYPRVRSHYQDWQARGRSSPPKNVRQSVNEEQRYRSYQTDVYRLSRNYRTGSSREDSPRYGVPSRVESTSYRTNYYHHERRRSPFSPGMDASRYRESTYQHSRAVHKPDYYQSSGTKYVGAAGDLWSKSYDNKWQSSYHRDSNKTDYTSRAPMESNTRQKEWQVRSSAHQSSAWQESTHSSTRQRDQYTYSDTRGPYCSSHKLSARRSRSRSQSLSDMSISSHSRTPVKSKSAQHKKSPARKSARTSRSPISVSSRSQSLSPVSKSPTPKASPTSKKDLVETVKHFLHLARGLRQNKKIEFSHSKGPRPLGSKHSISPPPKRSHSPVRSSGQPDRYIYSKPPKTNSPPRVIRSRNPQSSWSKRSPSPVKIRSHRDQRNRSISPVSSVGSRDSRDGSYPSRRRSSREADKSGRYESKWSHRAGGSRPSPHPDHSIRTTSGQKSEQRLPEQHRYSTDQPWYQERQHSSSMPVFNPAYPPPSFASANPYLQSQQHPSAYANPAASVPIYSYSQPPPAYGYSHVQPPNASVGQSVTTPQLAEAYQQAFTLLQSAMTNEQAGQSYAHSVSQSSSQQPNTSAHSGSEKKPSSSSQNKKSWSLGSNALVFQRILGKDGGKGNESGAIQKVGDRERVERPKVAKERVLTRVPVQKK